MMKIKYFRMLSALIVATILFACSDDIGNYTYDDKEIITIDMPTQFSALAFAEDINITPKITSNLKGEIDGNTGDFEFTCQRKNSDNEWVDIGEMDNKNIHIPANLDAGTYTCRYSVIDSETGVRYSKLFYAKFLTTTTEGWMVLCNEGQNNRVRLDMLSHLSFNRIIPAHDVLKTEPSFPELYNAVSLGFYANRRAIRNKIVLMSESGAYLLPTEDVFGYGSLSQLTEAYELQRSLFLEPSEERIYNFTTIAQQDWINHNSVLAVSKEGNAYAWNIQAVGSAFEMPINTTVRGGAPQYKVEPYVGATLSRYTTGMQQGYGIALLYDKDNKRFIGWDSEGDTDGLLGRKQTTYPLSGLAEDNNLFSFDTGFDLVAMLNTLTTTHCIMQDRGERYIYSINVMDKTFKQEGCYTEIDAPNFNIATSYAASSQYPVIYYAYKNKVYAYNYATNSYKESVVLDAGEEVTMLKFNRFDEPQGVALLVANMEEDNALEFRARENELIVGSYNTLHEGVNGGTLRFYQTTSPGLNLTLKPGWEFEGYAKIVDIKYKEVRR